MNVRYQVIKRARVTCTPEERQEVMRKFQGYRFKSTCPLEMEGIDIHKIEIIFEKLVMVEGEPDGNDA